MIPPAYRRAPQILQTEEHPALPTADTLTNLAQNLPGHSESTREESSDDGQELAVMVP